MLLDDTSIDQWIPQLSVILDLLTSNARRYDSLDPRLNVLESLAVPDLPRQATQLE